MDFFDYISGMCSPETTSYDESLDEVSDRIVLSFLPYHMRGDKHTLETTPHRVTDYGLVVVCELVKWEGEESGGICSITHQMIEEWGISEDELFALALEKSPEIFPPVIKTFEDVIGSDGKDGNLFILTNSIAYHGATTILYRGILKDFHKEHGDFLIIPSSTHEVLLATGLNGVGQEAMLREIVKSVNDEYVSDIDLLSYDVYKYDGEVITVCK